MRTYINLLLGSLLFGSVGCMKDVELDLPDQSSKVVLNGVLMEDSVIRVHLSESRFVLDPNALIPIENAKIALLMNGETSSNWKYITDGVYEARNIKPKAGTSYKIRIDAPGKELVEAEAIVPNSLSDVVLKSIDKLEFDYQQTVRITLEIKDTPGSEDYYMINHLIEHRYDIDEHESGRMEQAPLSTEDVNVIRTCEEDHYLVEGGCYVLFSDIIFEGKSREIVVSYTNWVDENPNNITKDHIMVSRISKDYYQHMISLYQNKLVDDNPFAEPSNIYMNVRGGYGILGASSVQRITIP